LPPTWCVLRAALPQQSLFIYSYIVRSDRSENLALRGS
jgi:hypothetical protein